MQNQENGIVLWQRSTIRVGTHQAGITERWMQTTVASLQYPFRYAFMCVGVVSAKYVYFTHRDLCLRQAIF